MAIGSKHLEVAQLFEKKVLSLAQASGVKYRVGCCEGPGCQGIYHDHTLETL